MVKSMLNVGGHATPTSRSNNGWLGYPGSRTTTLKAPGADDNQTLWDLDRLVDYGKFSAPIVFILVVFISPQFLKHFMQNKYVNISKLVIPISAYCQAENLKF